MHLKKQYTKLKEVCPLQQMYVFTIQINDNTKIIIYNIIKPLFNQVSTLRTHSHLQWRPGQKSVEVQKHKLHIKLQDKVVLN